MGGGFFRKVSSAEGDILSKAGVEVEWAEGIGLITYDEQARLEGQISMANKGVDFWTQKLNSARHEVSKIELELQVARSRQVAAEAEMKLWKMKQNAG